jgi:enoyl-CoA hydratase/carnithine racemase
VSPATSTVTTSRPAGGIAQITLSRPEAMNAISSAMAAELARTCAELAAAPEVRVVVLGAAGERAFSAGADLKERAAMTDADIMRQRLAIRDVFGALLALPQPVVAAVHGFALGGGCELALSCDLVVADETAVFGLPEVTVGLVPGGGGTQLALRRLGPGRAADLVLTGRKVGIDEAMRFGLVDRRVPARQADRAALDLAGQIAANSPVAVRAAKRAIRHGWGVSLEAGLDIEDAAWRTAALSADRREGIAAFVEKRKPAWPGQLARPVRPTFLAVRWPTGASTRPPASPAVTAKYGPFVFTVIAVSKPARRCEPALASAPAVVPARTVQVSSSVAPFQLAYTTEPPAGLTRAATAGLSAGWPAQSAVKARYDWSPTGNCPSSSSVPSAANSPDVRQVAPADQDPAVGEHLHAALAGRGQPGRVGVALPQRGRHRAGVQVQQDGPRLRLLLRWRKVTRTNPRIP